MAKRLNNLLFTHTEWNPFFVYISHIFFLRFISFCMFSKNINCWANIQTVDYDQGNVPSIEVYFNNIWAVEKMEKEQKLECYNIFERDERDIRCGRWNWCGLEFELIPI